MTSDINSTTTTNQQSSPPSSSSPPLSAIDPIATINSFLLNNSNEIIDQELSLEARAKLVKYEILFYFFA